MPSSADLAKIHIAKKQLAMDEDAYRSMLKSIGGVESAKDLSQAAVGRVLAHLKRCGFKTVTKKSDRKQADDAQSRKIRALWLQLHQLGAVRDPSEQALAAWIKRMGKIDALQWLPTDVASKAIEELKQWIKRVEAK